MRTEEIIVNIIFDAGKGSTPVQSREGVSGRPYGELPRPSRPGYRFDGWYLGDQPVTAGSILEATEDVRLTALCTLGTLGVFCAVYAIIYLITARSYSKIVGSGARVDIQ